MKIAFIGLGRMGSPIAQNLISAGHSLTVYNRTPKGLDGARTATSAVEAVAVCDAVVTMLANDAAVEALVLGKNGFLQQLSAQAVHLSLSTISIEMARRLAEEHGKRGQLYVGGAVFGRPDAAQAKKLVVVAAGEQALIDRCQPLFDAIGRATYTVGTEPWQANLIKVNGNFMIASMMETFSEAFATIRKAGVDHHQFYEIMNELFQSPVYKNYGSAIAKQAYEPAQFALKLGLKDIGLCLEASREFGAPMPIASILRDHYISALAHGEGDSDWSGIGRVAARLAGLETTKIR